LADEKMIEMVAVYPTAFYVRHDTIKVIIEGELPSPFIFIKTYNLRDPK
jgi:hypothetical protein